MTRAWSTIEDELFGKPGSPERDEVDARYERFRRQMERAERLTRWLRVFGPIGDLARVFWYLVLTEDDHNPRDGMEFAFLNDGYKPTLWHTWYSIWHDTSCPYSGIYPDGAPSSAVEAYSREHAKR